MRETPAASKCLQQLADRLVLVDGHDVGTRHHDVGDPQPAKAQDAQEHLALFDREGLAFAPFKASSSVARSVGAPGRPRRLRNAASQL